MSIGVQSAIDRDRRMVRAFKKAVIISLAAHVIFFGGVVVTQGLSLMPKRKQQVVNVNFYKPPGGKKGGGGKKTVVPPAKPKEKKPETKKPETKKPEVKKPEVKKTEAKKTEEKKPVAKKPEDKKKEIAKNDIKKPDTKPEKKDEVKKDEPKDDKLKPDEKSDETKPEPEKEGPKKPEPDLSHDLLRDLESDEAASSDKAGTGPADLPGEGDSRFDGAINGVVGDSILGAYFGKVMDQILGLLRIPPSVPSGRGLKVDVYIYVDADGKVLEYKVDSLSGNQTLDAAVSDMLDQLKQLPAPPPEKMSGSRFELPLRFEP